MLDGDHNSDRCNWCKLAARLQEFVQYLNSDQVTLLAPEEYKATVNKKADEMLAAEAQWMSET